MSWLLQRVTGLHVLVAVGSYLAFALVLFNTGPYPRLQKLTDRAGILDERPGYTPEEVQALFTALGPSGRATYRQFLQLDLFNALLLAAMLGLSLAWIVRRLRGPNSRWGMSALAPLALGLADMVENLLLLRLLQQYPDTNPGLVSLAAGVTLGKWALAGLLLPLTLIGFVAVGVHGLFRPGRRA